MKNKSELVEIIFLPELENIVWKKRSPHIINYKKFSLEIAAPINNTENYLISKTNLDKRNVSNKPDGKEMIKDIHKIQRYIFNREQEIRHKEISLSRKKKVLDLLQTLLIIISENKKYYSDKQMLSDSINRIHILINNIKKQLTNKLSTQLETNFINDVGIENSNNRNTILRENSTVIIKRTSTKSQRGIIIEKTLNEIKTQIKNQNISQTKKNAVYAKLMELKEEIELYMHTFTSADNILGKFEQIEHYCNRLQSMSFDNQSNQEELHKSTEKTRQAYPKSSEKESTNKKTVRGIEIQKKLMELKYEVKRKDLNSIEIDNLINVLLQLQKEMAMEIEKFSKSDSIAIRLDQVDEYLKKLGYNTRKEKKSETIKTVSVEKGEQNTNQNKKMHTIYHFGL